MNSTRQSEAFPVEGDTTNSRKAAAIAWVIESGCRCRTAFRQYFCVGNCCAFRHHSVNWAECRNSSEASLEILSRQCSQLSTIRPADGSRLTH